MIKQTEGLVTKQHWALGWAQAWVKVAQASRLHNMARDDFSEEMLGAGIELPIRPSASRARAASSDAEDHGEGRAPRVVLDRLGQVVHEPAGPPPPQPVQQVREISHTISVAVARAMGIDTGDLPCHIVTHLPEYWPTMANVVQEASSMAIAAPHANPLQTRNTQEQYPDYEDPSVSLNLAPVVGM
ncbi:hypothetical protein AK812_SmicGene33130 [Symbiodinium microadriaticum]|uniref:Uncharacterized protein n=1 Tax=Symbiodinium microadriaticum TaxID=2951 RepID=A0A1Q9CSG0_SYMMI|nr:hypothetical protein AK812_SmicGene33130 [Symbiodinium microadriaticum]CAE7939617.1 unnamed protein product [Symbiodinium sp. KB8]